jgi:endo-1,4-beta-xylanase
MMKATLLTLSLTSTFGIRGDSDLVSLYGKKQMPKTIRVRETPSKTNAATTLRQGASAHGVFMGTAINVAGFDEATYQSTFFTEFDLSTAENECKFGETQPAQNQFDFSGCDTLSNTTIDGDSGTFRGHNFIWGGYNPQWILDGNFNEQTLIQLMQSHISTLINRYESRFYCWDVVNEAVSDVAKDPILKASPPWYPLIATTPANVTYLDVAFIAAKSALSTNSPVKLCYNEYGAEDMGIKSNKTYELISGLLSRGIQVDCVGFQSHFAIDAHPAPADVAKNMDRLGKLGVEIHITEMDVKCPDPCGNGTANRALQAQIYSDMLQVCISSPYCKSFEAWGITDKHSWIALNENPLIWDQYYNKKPEIYDQMLAVLNGADWGVEVPSESFA